MGQYIINHGGGVVTLIQGNVSKEFAIEHQLELSEDGLVFGVLLTMQEWKDSKEYIESLQESLIKQLDAVCIRLIQFGGSEENKKICEQTQLAITKINDASVLEQYDIEHYPSWIN